MIVIINIIITITIIIVIICSGRRVLDLGSLYYILYYNYIVLYFCLLVSRPHRGMTVSARVTRALHER